MLIPYIDNSILTELRLECSFKDEGSMILRPRVQLILEIVNKYNIGATDCIITDKLFLEVIERGSFRRKIVNTNSKWIDELKDKFYESSFSHEDIASYFNSLSSFWIAETKKALPKNEISSMAKESVNQRPFIDDFRSLELKIIQYAQQITDCSQTYENFISTLVTDSIIRNMLFNLPKNIIVSSFHEILTFLTTINWQAIPDILSLIMAGLKERSEHYFGLKGRPHLLGLNKDFADADPQQLVLYGKNINGKRYPVVFLTNEKIESIKKRFEFYIAGIVAGCQNTQRYKNQLLCIGKTVVITNFEKYEEIPLKFYLQHISATSYHMVTQF